MGLPNGYMYKKEDSYQTVLFVYLFVRISLSTKLMIFCGTICTSCFEKCSKPVIDESTEIFFLPLLITMFSIRPKLLSVLRQIIPVISLASNDLSGESVFLTPNVLPSSVTLNRFDHSSASSAIKVIAENSIYIPTCFLPEATVAIVGIATESAISTKQIGVKLADMVTFIILFIVLPVYLCLYLYYLSKLFIVGKSSTSLIAGELVSSITSLSMP